MKNCACALYLAAGLSVAAVGVLGVGAFETQPPVTSSAAAATEPGLLLHFGIQGAEPQNGVVTDLTGRVRATIKGQPARVTLGPTEGYRFHGATDWLVLADDAIAAKSKLPTRELTAAAWVNVAETQAWGSIIGCIQDNGNAEKGWLLGYNTDHFVLALASKGADDGDGAMTYLAGKTPIVPGRWYHVAGVYDGTTMRLYVNGKLDAESTAQKGDILYPDAAPFTIACYQDRDEQYPMNGTMLEVKLHDRALPATVFANEAAAGARVISWEPPSTGEQAFVVKPFLQYATKTGMTFVWETTRRGQGWVEFGEALPFDRKSAKGSEGTAHEIRVEGLSPQTMYFYRVHTTSPDGPDLVSDTLTFQTAVHDDGAYAFGVIGDTQRNPAVIQRLQDFTYSLRPNFQIHLGDVVDEGPSKHEWTKEMLAGSWNLMSRVCMFPAIGNHEKNHSLYYQYFAVPDPEYYYTYTYGNAQFFSIDTNKPMDPQSEQYRWLDEQLGKSKATWKFVYHHHPVYSSDENDYGDTYKERSFWGDRRIRHLADLYERHGVDINFNGHIHCYERSWPLRQGKIDQDRGVIYLTSGGGGGGLESAAPSRTWFAKRTYRGHHITYIMIHDKTLQLQAFDLEGRLFDTMELRKK